MIRNVLTLPDRMISRRSTTPGFKLESALIVVFGLLGAAGVGYVGSQALAAYDGSGETLRFEFIGVAARPFAALVLLWIAYTVVPHVLASTFGGRSPASRMFRASAWALIPIGVWMTLRSVVIFALFLGVEYPADPEGLGAEEQYQTIMELGLETPIYTATLLVGALFAVWSGYLLSLAVEEIKGISTDDARKVAAIPSGLTALYFVWLAVSHAGIV